MYVESGAGQLSAAALSPPRPFACHCHFPPCCSYGCLEQWCRTRRQPKCPLCQAEIKHLVVDGQRQVSRFAGRRAGLLAPSPSRPIEALSFISILGLCQLSCRAYLAAPPGLHHHPGAQKAKLAHAPEPLLAPPVAQPAPEPDRLEEEGPDLGCLDHAYFAAESDRLLCR